MTQPDQPDQPPLPPTVPVFRLAFAIVGALIFGASSLVGLAILFMGDYTTTLACDRAANRCEIHYRSASKVFPLAELASLDSKLEKNARNRSPSQNLYATYTGGKSDFLCAVPAGSDDAPKLEALATQARVFLAGQQPSLDLRCQGKLATVADGLLMAVFSAILASASVLTLVRALRQKRSHPAGQ